MLVVYVLPCSVQYLQQPEKVFAEVCRVLKPGGVAIFTFSNRMFYEKVGEPGWHSLEAVC
jgi:ubiquinone/menaquinone biosynthesis C-methylase UbiE